MQLLSGYAYFSLYTALLLGAYLLLDRKPSRKAWGALVLATLGALAASAVQWLPFLDYLGYAYREIWDRTTFCFTPIEFLTLLKPDILGVPGTGSFRGVYGNYIYNPYFGLLPLAAFLAAVLSKRLRTPFFTWAALGMLALATGFRFLPEPLQPSGLVNHLEPVKASPLFVFAALTAGLGALGRADARKRLSAGWVGALLAALWMADLLAVPHRLVLLVKDPYRDEAVVRDARNLRLAAGQGRLLTLRDQTAYFPEGATASFQSSLDYSARWLIPNTNAVWGARSVNGYLSNAVDGFQNIRRYLRRGVGNERLLDAAGVALLALPAAPGFPKYQVRQTLADNVLVRNAGALGPGWRAPFVREFPDRVGVMLGLMDPGAFLEQEVFTEKAPDGKAVRLPAPGRELGGQGPSSFGAFERLAWRLDRWMGGPSRVASERPSACRQEFVADYKERGWLAFNETFAPGWRAWVDGKPKTVFRAYGLFMAVPVGEAGLHRVEFRYEPTAFRLGLFVTLATLMLLGVGVGAFRDRPRS
jgi:hypothetical protein